MVININAKLTSYQRDILFSKARFTICEASTKVGKAQPLDSRVYTPNGYKAMGDINPNDKILTPFGKSKVVDVFPQGKLPVYRVTFNDRSFTECCLDHLWEVNGKVKSTKQLLQISPKRLRHYSIPHQGVAQFNKQEYPIHPYLLGVLIADGCLTGAGIKVSISDRHVLAKVHALLPDNYSFTHCKGCDYSISLDSLSLAALAGHKKTTLQAKLRELSLFGLKSGQKFIPDVYKYNSEWVRKEIIKGIFDSDGYVDDKGQPRLEQTSKRLADDVREIIESLGGYVKQTKKEHVYYRDAEGKKVICNAVYRQGIIIDDSKKVFSSPRQRNKCRAKKKPVQRNIKSIEYVGEKECKCISIADNRSLYLTDNFIVTHNTFSHIIWLFSEAMKEQPKAVCNYWWVAPTYSQAKIAFNRLNTVLAGIDAFKWNRSELFVKCPNGSFIHFKTGDKPDNLYGEDVYAAVFDEAPRSKYQSFVALRSTLTATKGKLKMIGNFGGSANWMHQLQIKNKQDPNYEYFKINCYDAVKEGILDAEEVEQARKDLTEREFKMLYLAEPVTNEMALVYLERIQDIYTNEYVRHKSSSKRYLTADIALEGSDKFVIMIWEGFEVIDIIIRDKIDSSAVEALIKELMRKYAIPQTNVTYDADGVGNYLKSKLPHAHAFVNNSTALSIPTTHGKLRKPNYFNLRSQCDYLTAELINNGKIYVSSIEDDVKSKLSEEIEAIEIHTEMTDGKLRSCQKSRVKEKIGRSPDLWDALKMRALFILKPRISGTLDNSYFLE